MGVRDKQNRSATARSSGTLCRSCVEHKISTIRRLSQHCKVDLSKKDIKRDAENHTNKQNRKAEHLPSEGVSSGVSSGFL